jgi:serine/threonine protein kinase/Tol biopolymer transport system component
MKPKWWRKVEQLFYAALERETDQRATLLDQSCAGSEWLRHEVESLLKAHERSHDFIQQPIIINAVEHLTARQTAFIAGLQLDHYQLLEPLGAGGMGEVYLAQDLKLDRKVALKLLPALFMTNDEHVRRLKREARSVSALNHPNILTIYEIGETGSTHYIVTEYIDGVTLRQHMAGGRIEVGEVLDVALQVASALAAAHSAGITHRDIKPENIMMRVDGYVKVVDFGLAGHAELQSLAAPEVNRMSATRTGLGELIGTVKYMSPEQIQGHVVDARSDIWSLGVVLYEMLTGRTPFDGPTVSHTLNSILETEPQPLESCAFEKLNELQRIVARTLAKQSEERYQTAQELAADLRQLKQHLELAQRLVVSGLTDLREVMPQRESEPQTVLSTSAFAPQDTKPSRASAILNASRQMIQEPRFKLWLIIILAVIVILASGRQWIGNLGGQRPPPVDIIRMRRLTTAGNAVAAAVSPDGTYFVYAAEDAGLQSLRGRQVNSGPEADRQLLPPGEVSYVGLSFSPNGQDVYYVVKENHGSEGTLYRLPAQGGTARNLQVGDIETPVTFSPDGSRIAFVTRDVNSEQTLKLAGADGTNVQNLASRKYPNFFMNPAWSPEGETIACVAGSYLDGFFMTIINMRVRDGVEKPLTSQRWWSVRRLAWQSDGRGLFLVGMDQAAGMPSYVAHITYPSGEVKRITRDLNDYRELSVMSGGKGMIAVQSIQTSDFWVAPVGETPRARLITHSKYDRISGMAWTPDGRIVHALRRAGENSNIWSINADGSERVQLTDTAGNNLDPAVSPDGRYVVFASTRSGAANIWRVAIDGGSPQQLTSGSSEWWPSVSPDSRWVIYTSFANARPTLWKVSIDGGAPVQLGDRFSILSVVSPNGDAIACYLWGGDSKFELKMAVMKTDGGKVTATFAAPNGKFQTLQWTSNGEALAYIHDRDGMSNIWVQPIAGGPSKTITDFKAEHIFNFALSRDGKQIAFDRGSVTNDVVLFELQ